VKGIEENVRVAKTTRHHITPVFALSVSIVVRCYHANARFVAHVVTQMLGAVFAIARVCLVKRVVMFVVSKMAAFA
jgi:hypothetical protein